MKAKALSSIVLSILIVAISVFVIKGLLSSAPALKVKPSIAKPVLVEILELKKDNIDIAINGFGQVASRKSLEVVSQVKGRVAKLYRRLEPGMRVMAGEKLLKIDQRDYKIEADIARAQLGKAKASLKRFDGTVANLVEMEKIHRGSYNLQIKEVARTRKLFDEKMVSATVMDKVVLDVQNRFERLQSTLNEMRLIPEKQIDAIADIISAESRLNLAMLNLSRTVINAPFSGNVISSDVIEGKYINAGSRLVSIEDTGHLEVVIPVSVDDFKWLDISEYAKDGLLSRPIAVSVEWEDAVATSHSWTGWLTRIGGGLKTGDQTLDLYVDIDTVQSTDSDNNQMSDMLVLKRGMFVSVAIPGKRVENVITIPRSSLRMGGERVFVMTRTGVNDNSEGASENSSSGVLEIRKVKIIRFQGEYALVSSGLEDGDLLIVNPIKNVANGQTLRAVDG